MPKSSHRSEVNRYGQQDDLVPRFFSNSCLNNTPAYAYLSSRLGKTTYLFANLVALVYNVFNSFGLGYYKLFKIPSYLY